MDISKFKINDVASKNRNRTESAAFDDLSKERNYPQPSENENLKLKVPVCLIGTVFASVPKLAVWCKIWW